VIPDLNRFAAEYIDNSESNKGFLGILNEVNDILKNL
jgi:hypothetical protein